MDLIQSLQWRYASKRMNGQTVPREKVDRILEAIRLAPSSMGLQPYTVLVITDPQIKKSIRPIAYNQPQIEESSHLLVFAAWADITLDQVEAYIAHMAHTRRQPAEALAAFRQSLLGIIEKNTPAENYQWAARQAYIAFGTAITAAAAEEVDTTPMEGFDAAALDHLLGLNEKGLRSVTLLPLGYRDAENDRLAHLPKVRREKSQLFIEH